MRTAISVPDDLFHQAEREAKNQGVSRSKFIQLALRDYLDRLNRSRLTRQIDEVCEATETSLDPDWERLTDEVWESEGDP